MKTRKMIVGIDPVLACPCGCAFCGVGSGKVKGGGYLQPAQLLRLLEATASKVDIVSIGLYYQGEPFLHPQLPELVKIAEEFAPVTVSTSATVRKFSLEDLAESGLSTLLVSVPGWSPKTYNAVRPGGDLDAVRQTMIDAAHYPFRRRVLYWHRYRWNLHEESDARTFAKRCGMEFHAVWAWRLSPEDNMADREFPCFVLNAAETRAVLDKSKARHCWTGRHLLGLCHDGGVRVCPAALDQSTVGNIFTDSVEDMLRRHKSSPLCQRCVSNRCSRVIYDGLLALDWACIRKAPFRFRYYFEFAKNCIWKTMHGRL
jgi:MoaA/NifB/PqqE/SkfB family radical SAM enzyme